MNINLKQAFLTAILLLGCFINFASGQSFRVQSFNGGQKVIELLPNYEKNILAITCSKDTIYIRNLIHIKTATLLNSNFLMVAYSTRAGTGMNLIQTLILSASDSGICESLNVTSLFKDEFLDFNNYVTSPMKVEVETIYKADLSLKANSGPGYKLSAKIHSERKSVHDPKSNYDHHVTASLNFDSHQQVFYNLHERISGHFTIFDPKTQLRIKQYISGTYSVAKLGEYKYYYINKAWYEASDKANFHKQSYR